MSSSHCRSGSLPWTWSGNGIGIFCEPVNETAPSLRNILQEWQVDLGISAIPNGDLTAWAQRGVLLMNRVLTVLPGVRAVIAILVGSILPT